MENLAEIGLNAVTIMQNAQSEQLGCKTAKLYVHDDSYEKSWYADLESIADTDWLDRMRRSADIRVVMRAVAADGRVLIGEGHLYPNQGANNATIRGSGELLGL